MALEGKVSDSRGQEFSVEIVPVPFSAMRLINDLRYLEEGREERYVGG